MTVPTRVAGAPRTLVAAALALVVLAGSPSAVAFAASETARTGATSGVELALPAWTGGIELYRAGSFTTQRSWLWCTAAGVQIARNIVDHQRDHSTSSQRAYFDWMRGHNRYDLPLSAGVDAQGWAAGMRHFVDARYRLVSSGSFDSALRSAVQRMRLTNLPVAITVSHGNHGWLLVGFRATADPARTDRFTVTSVRVVGPLFGLQSRNGYDMPPNTRLTPAQLRGFFTPWHYDPRPMIWDGRYVSIQPIPRTASTRPAATPATKGTPAPKPVAKPVAMTAAATTPVSVETAPAVAEGVGSVDPARGDAGVVADAVDVAAATGPPAETGTPDPSGAPDLDSDQTALIVFFLIALPIAAVAAAMLGPWRRRRPG
jgi:hypothetical protein